MTEHEGQGVFILPLCTLAGKTLSTEIDVLSLLLCLFITIHGSHS